MRRKKYNFIPLIALIIITLLACTIAYRYNRNKYKDINYTVQHYITTGLLNKYKMYKIDKIDIAFSDGSLAVMNVTGVQDKAPHKNVSYKVFLEKDKYGIWRVRKVYNE